MYRILLLVTLTVVSSLACLHHSCSAAFKACDNHHNTQECWDWADETFHCCDECERCDTPKEEKQTSNVDWENECHSQLCDEVFDVCTRMHPNSTDCTAKADKASHCCYLCLSCPDAQRAKFSERSVENGRRHHQQCDEDLCNAVYEHCTESTHHNHSSTYCQDVADRASDCSGKCRNLKSMSATKDRECHAKFCNAVLDVCTHSSNSTECQYKADEASNCCYDCLDCPSGVELPSRPKYDHCLSNLCLNVYGVCIETEHDADKCRSIAIEVSDCCSSIDNPCMDCHDEKMLSVPSVPKTLPTKRACHPEFCNAVLDVCTHSSNSTDCQYKADEA